jgi:hypothetical protein
MAVVIVCTARSNAALDGVVEEPAISVVWREKKRHMF